MKNTLAMFVSAFVLGMGVIGVFNYRRYSKDQVKNHEKYIRGGKSASKFEESISRYSILLGAIFATVLGLALLTKTILNF